MEKRIANTLQARRLGIDTLHEPVVFMRLDCPVCRSEGFEAHSRVEITAGSRRIVATLNVVHGDLLSPGEAGLSEIAWSMLHVEPGEMLHFAHPAPVDSMSFVRAKVYAERLNEGQLDAIIRDITAGLYSNVELAAFITGCANSNLDRDEIVSLTRAMVNVGERLSWSQPMVVDKHCVGGLPGNRTTMIVVPICAALGLTMPKTSSRAITSPSGTADAMEVLAPVDLTLPQMRNVVEREHGCIVWGGAMYLSPADDILVRVERSLDLDSEGQLIASVLSKKIAAGSTHAVLDLPVGPTAKVRSEAAAHTLAELLESTARSLGLYVRTLVSDGTQPVGRGIGPALEAKDVLAVLQGADGAPADLRERALAIAEAVVEMAGLAVDGEARRLVEAVLDDGRAWHKFMAICDAQGGMREVPEAAHQRPVSAPYAGIVQAVDNRMLSRVAKLAGAPQAKAAGLVMGVRVGDRVEAGQPLFTVHAEAPGELDYALEYCARHPGIVALEAS